MKSSMNRLVQNIHMASSSEEVREGVVTYLNEKVVPTWKDADNRARLEKKYRRIIDRANPRLHTDIARAYDTFVNPFAPQKLDADDLSFVYFYNRAISRQDAHNLATHFLWRKFDPTVPNDRAKQKLHLWLGLAASRFVVSADAAWAAYHASTLDYTLDSWRMAGAAGSLAGAYGSY